MRIGVRPHSIESLNAHSLFNGKSRDGDSSVSRARPCGGGSEGIEIGQYDAIYVPRDASVTITTKNRRGPCRVFRRC